MHDLDIRPDLAELVRVLVEWARPAKGATVYLFGSRVRGDHRPDSDLDIIVDFGDPATDEASDWWTETNGIEFADLEAKLPGIPVHNPRQYTEELLRRVRESEVIFQEGNVCCVLMSPKAAPDLDRMKPHGLEVGRILVTGQAEFYKVIEVLNPRAVILQEVEQIAAGDGKVVPGEKAIGEPIRCPTPYGEAVVKWQLTRLWDGKPKPRPTVSR